MQIEPLAATLGATVTGVNLRRLTTSDWQAIESGFNQYAVVVFKDQHLNDAEQVVFSQRFGRMERSLSRSAGRSAIANLSNVDAAGNPAAAGSTLDLFLKGNTYWHTDSSFKIVGAKASLLSPRALPSTGGETEFADMRAAWDALGPAMQEKLTGLEAIHSYWYSQSLVGGTELFSQEDWDDLPPVSHPVVKIHPETGRKNLYIGRHASHIVGMPEAEGRQLLQHLVDDGCQPPRTYLHRWEAGDLVLWDNRCVLHRGYEWPKTEARTMHRTTVAGDGDNIWALD